jgi:hypothetical protein
MTCFITEKEPWVGENTGEYAGLTVPPKIKKMGYKGVESTERCPSSSHATPQKLKQKLPGQTFLLLYRMIIHNRLQVSIVTS